MFAAIKQKLSDWWIYSRTIFLNALSIFAMAATELVSLALSQDWASVIKNPTVLFYWVLAINALNILLRFMTTKPVGQKGD